MTGYKKAFRKAFPYTIPVLTGYLFIGIAFGVMYAEKGYSFLWAILMSVLVYAGSGQYLAVNFFVPGFSFAQVIFLTFMVNVRHIFYGLSLVEKFNKIVVTIILINNLVILKLWQYERLYNILLLLE